MNTVGQYKPLPFGFGKYKKGVKPSDHALDVSAAGSSTGGGNGMLRTARPSRNPKDAP